MSSKETKKPIQKRSIETRNRLMDTALILYADKGYHYVTMDEIAAAAGMSTGIAYRYFKNKKDMLLQSLAHGFEKIQEMTQTDQSSLNKYNDEYEMLSYALSQFEMIHRKYYSFHEELEGLRHSDRDVKVLYDKIETNAVQELTDRLKLKVKHTDHLKEKVLVSIGMMEQYCHIATDNKYDDADLNVVTDMTIRTVLRFFSEQAPSST